MYDESYGPTSHKLMIFELDDDLLCFCQGDKTGHIPLRPDPEAGKAARDTLLAGLGIDSRPAQGATEEAE